MLTTQTVLCYHTYRQQVVNAWYSPQTSCDASQTHRTGNHTTIQIRLQHMRLSAVVTQIKYHRIKSTIHAAVIVYRITRNRLYIIASIVCPRFIRWYFLFTYMSTVLNKRIYVSVIYVLYLYMSVHGLFY